MTVRNAPGILRKPVTVELGIFMPAAPGLPPGSPVPPIQRSTTTLKIVPEPAFRICDGKVLEPPPGESRVLTVRVRTQVPVLIRASVEVYDKGTGTATVGRDYVAFEPVRLYFGPGDQEKTFGVTVLGDNDDREPAETIVFGLRNPVGGVLDTNDKAGEGRKVMNLVFEGGDRHEAAVNAVVPLRRAVIEFPSGQRYEGMVDAADLPHGRGVETHPDGGRRYKGDWVAGIREGRGVMTWEDGSKYDGEWRNHGREGQGIMLWSDGTKYDGEWRADEREGYGILERPDGSRYEGEWCDGKPQGRGVLVATDGSHYEGGVQNGKAHGQGVQVFPTGERHEGAFRGGHAHGAGVHTWKTGQRVEGVFRNGKAHGAGRIEFEDGSIYEGQIRGDIPSGDGVFTEPDGKRRRALFTTNRHGEERPAPAGAGRPGETNWPVAVLGIEGISIWTGRLTCG